MKDSTYIVVQTGYTQRISDRISGSYDYEEYVEKYYDYNDPGEEVFCHIKESLLFTNDTTWGNGVVLTNGTNEDVDNVQELCKKYELEFDGIAVFRKGKAFFPMIYIGSLITLQYCACMDYGSIDDMFVNHEIAHFAFDCESG